MDAAVLEMVLTAFEETRADALGHGHDATQALKEALTAAAMCLSAMTGVEDSAARAEIEALNPMKLLAA
ncbi:MAG: hypothetical protein HYU59_12305 [Magnetospirillum gryphiswaldense]|uniref:hypothetical protein n=1 Tax=Magnetospirillum sp. 64-120 TaxID=1895778 RepID=UPI0009293D0D|nr:hypothetical protein [Magnetospirillum sp. 64-120]MBI2241570.1 hypothetical protein [Magnetospirillum gryphiswaldense]OJX81897.1 MAG: hypothetical protein BGO92_16400 [Magnetospirillum sp. 64-120]